MRNLQQSFSTCNCSRKLYFTFESQTTYPTELAAGNAQLHLINMAPYNFDVKLLPIGNDDGTTLDFSIDSMTNKIASSSVKEGTYKLEFMNDETNTITCANDDAKQFMLHGEQVSLVSSLVLIKIKWA